MAEQQSNSSCHTVKNKGNGRKSYTTEEVLDAILNDEDSWDESELEIDGNSSLDEGWDYKHDQC